MFNAYLVLYSKYGICNINMRHCQHTRVNTRLYMQPTLHNAGRELISESFKFCQIFTASGILL